MAALHTERAQVGIGRGALADADLDVQLALELVPDGHLLLPEVLAVAMEVALERGDLGRAKELAEPPAGALERERLFVDRYLVSRGRVRTAERRRRRPASPISIAAPSCSRRYARRR